DMKRAAEDKSAGLIKELEDMRARISDIQVSHEHLSQQVASLKEQVSGKEKLKAAFKEFKLYEDERVEQRSLVVKRFKVSFAGSVGGLEGCTYGCDYGCFISGERHWRDAPQYIR
nr:hypothetical protein [Tanacetum cinerariifolium]